MLDVLARHIKTNLGQTTDLFNKRSQNVVIVTKENTIQSEGLNGWWTLSGGSLTGASAGSINETLHFDENGRANAGTYLGPEHTQTVKAKDIDVGSGFGRDEALESIIPPTVGNCATIYLGAARAVKNDETSSIGTARRLKLAYSFGVLFKVDTQAVKELGIMQFDRFFINCVIGVKGGAGSSVVNFEEVVERLYAGESYVVDLAFSVTEPVLDDEVFLRKIKSFDAGLSLATQ